MGLFCGSITRNVSETHRLSASLTAWLAKALYGSAYGAGVRLICDLAVMDMRSVLMVMLSPSAQVLAR